MNDNEDIEQIRKQLNAARKLISDQVKQLKHERNLRAESLWMVRSLSAYLRDSATKCGADLSVVDGDKTSAAIEYLAAVRGMLCRTLPCSVTLDKHIILPEGTPTDILINCIFFQFAIKKRLNSNGSEWLMKINEEINKRAQSFNSVPEEQPFYLQ